MWGIHTHDFASCKKLTDILQNEELIIDLLPQVHRKSYVKKGLNVIEVEFLILDKKQGKKITAGHYGKAVKGKFIRFLATNGIQNTDNFKNNAITIGIYI